MVVLTGVAASWPGENWYVKACFLVVTMHVPEVLCQLLASPLPKEIFIDMYENLRQSSQENISSNVNVIYYKRIKHAKKWYGTDTDYGGWTQPFQWNKHYKYLDSEVCFIRRSLCCLYACRAQCSRYPETGRCSSLRPEGVKKGYGEETAAIHSSWSSTLA